jgi:cytochrome o ubiquinol oxidase operon protein cyoD
MNDITASTTGGTVDDVCPGLREHTPSFRAGLGTYFIGLALAAGLTIASFWAAQTHLIYGPGVHVALVTLAIAQMGIHLVFFLHITTAPGQVNNVLALAFGVLIVGFVLIGSRWIMSHMNQMMPAMDQMLRMQG